MGLQVQCQNEATVFIVEVKIIPETKKYDIEDQKTMLNVFVDCEGLMCYDFIAICQTQSGYINFFKKTNRCTGWQK
jgi:hypothetical protein